MNEIKWEKQDKASFEVALFLFEYFKENHEIRNFSNCIKNVNICIIGRVNEEIIAAEVSEDNEILYSAVREDFRGKGLQRELMNRSLWFISKNEDEFSCAYMCVRAKNIASLKNALKLGFEIRQLAIYDFKSGMQDGYQLEFSFASKVLIDPKL